MSLLVSVPNWLGDLIMAMPALSSLQSETSRLTFWSNPRVSGILPVFYPGSDVLTDRIPPRGEFGRLLLLTDSFRSALMGTLAGIPIRIGYSTECRGFLLTRRIVKPKGRDHHHSLDYAALAREIVTDPSMKSPKPCAEASGFPHAAFFAGARYGSAKRWGGFRRLAREIHAATGLPPVFYGSIDETNTLMDMADGVPEASVESHLDFPGLVSSVQSAGISVGNDSGGVHLSALLGVPTVTIFGSTSATWTAPSGPRTATIASDRFCSPCFRRTCPAGRPACLDEIPAEHVFETCMNLLGQDDHNG